VAGIIFWNYVIVGAVLTGMVPWRDLGVADPLARALQVAGYERVGWIVALGAVISMSSSLCGFRPRLDLFSGPRNFQTRKS
jgi:APA family basic amino acid/polyamine antiporter